MLRDHLRSNLVGYVALFVALGGTAVALPTTGTIFSRDIADGEVRSADVRDDDLRGGGLAAADLARGSVGPSEIAKDAVGAAEIAPDSITGKEVSSRTLDGFKLKAFSVGSTELDSVYERSSSASTVTDGTAHDGIFGRDIAAVTCRLVGDKLLSASIDWTDTNGRNEAMLSEIIIDRTGAFDQAVAAAVFDGGGGAADPARFVATATCLGGG